MAKSVLVDAGFVVALLNQRDGHHQWAVAQAAELPPPWIICEAALSEAFHLLSATGRTRLAALIRREALTLAFRFGEDSEAVLRLIEKYRDVPMSLADACLVRMTETLNDPLLLTTDRDFGIYRRHGRQTIPCAFPR